MKTTTEKQLEKSFDGALSDLKKNLKKSGQGKTYEITKTDVLMKAQKAVKAGKMDIMTAGNIEGRLNKNIPLEKAHRAVLGLKEGARIEGLDSPKQSSPAARMGTAGSPGQHVPPVNSIVDKMAIGQRLAHSYQTPGGNVVMVTGAEVLRKCQELVRKGQMTLSKAGDLERAVNTGLPIRPELLRFIFNE